MLGFSAVRSSPRSMKSDELIPRVPYWPSVVTPKPANGGHRKTGQ
jgi:hypothetical protein